ncbi:hypothetical protein C9J60_11840 [Streptomyces sp. A244]|nr:hypothetical protein C9J60_11840 [Streptomyces sp. A244]
MRGTPYIEHAASFEVAHHHFEANSLGLLGAAEWMSGDIDQAQIYYEEAIRIFRGIGLEESEREM